MNVIPTQKNCRGLIIIIIIIIKYIKIDRKPIKILTMYKNASNKS
jgi:hypothetical protein